MVLECASSQDFVMFLPFDSLRLRRFVVADLPSKFSLQKEQTAYTHCTFLLNGCVQCHNVFLEPQYTKFANMKKKTKILICK